jgi:hypothetical protein
MFDGNEVIVLEGEEGSGKSVLAAQFATKHSAHTFSFFTSGISSFARSLEYSLSVIADQLYYFFNGVSMPDSVDIPEVIRTLRLKLQRRANLTQTRFYFVIDGLLEVPDLDTYVLHELLTNYLPVGIPNFRFLLTGPCERLPVALLHRGIHKPWSSPGFGPEDVRALLPEFQLSDRTLYDLVATFGGSPGKIASVRRILCSGVPVETLEADLPSTLSDLFKMEWHAVDRTDVPTVDVLSLVAHAKHDLRINDLAHILRLASTEVESRLRRFSFIKVDGPAGIASFVTPSFKAFAMDELMDRQAAAIDRIIGLLWEDKLSDSAIQHLPAYLRTRGRQEEVLSYLDLDHLSALCERAASVAPVRMTLQSGLASAGDLEDSASAFRFALQAGLMSDLSAAPPLASEVEARIELGQPAAALTLAQRAILKEDRLELLSIVIRHMLEADRSPDESLVAEIRELLSDVDYSGTPQRAVAVASALLPVVPEQAIQLVERSGSDNDYPLDIALAQLSLAVHDFEGHLYSRQDFSESITKRIADRDVRQTARALSAMVPGRSVSELLNKADELSNTRQCVYLLEQWASRNPEHPNASDVVDYALTRIVRASDYTLSADTLRRLAVPLPKLADERPDIANRLLLTIEAQLELAKKRGPTIQYVRLCVLLSETEATWSPEDALKRIEALCYFIADLDADVKCEAFAWLIRTIQLDRYARLELVRSTLLDTIEAAFDNAVHAVLGGTAEHLEALRGAISALSGADTDRALRVCEGVNIQERRDALCAGMVAAILRRDLAKTGPSTFVKLLGRIADRVTRDRWTLEVLRVAHDRKLELLTDEWDILLRRSFGIERAPWRAQACAYAYTLSLRSTCNELKNCADQYLRYIEPTLTSINSTWGVADIGFSVAMVLAGADQTVAEKFLAIAKSQQTASVFIDGNIAEAYLTAVRLTARAFAGLLPQRLDIDTSYSRLRRIIAAVPSDGERARVWSTLALRCFAVGHRGLGTEIVDNEIAPALGAITDNGYRTFILCEVAPALYCAHPVAATRQLTSLEYTERNDAFQRICWYLLRRVPGNEPLGRPFSPQPLIASEVDDVLACLENIDRDHTFSSVANLLCDALLSATAGARITSALRADVARRLLDIASKKLPSPRGIAHGGYGIFIRALAGRLHQNSREYWEQLRTECASIPNTADRVFVLGTVAEAMPQKHEAMRRELIREARELADKIPSAFDKMTRLRSLGESCTEFADDLAKEYLVESFRMCIGKPGEWMEHQRSIVDLAYRVDEGFAKSLMEQLEDDPAVLRGRDAIKRQLELKRVLKGVPKDGLPVAGPGRLDNESLGEICWTMLGGLHSGTVSYQPVTDSISLMKRAAVMPLAQAYPSFAWTVENAIACHSKTPFGATYLVKLFHSCAMTCELGLNVVARAAGRVNLTVVAEDGQARTDQSVRIGPGEREKALQTIRDWIVEHHPRYLKISDPYFSTSDVGLLKIILDCAPNCSVEILCGEKKQLECGLTFPYDVAYQKAWNEVSEHNPPETDIVVAGYAKGGECPIHERWVICEDSALKLGTSYGGLGGGKLTDISKLPASVARDRAVDLDDYLYCRVREHKGEKIRYTTFSLPIQ